MFKPLTVFLHLQMGGRFRCIFLTALSPRPGKGTVSRSSSATVEIQRTRTLWSTFNAFILLRHPLEIDTAYLMHASTPEAIARCLWYGHQTDRGTSEGNSFDMSDSGKARDDWCCA